MQVEVVFRIDNMLPLLVIFSIWLTISNSKKIFTKYHNHQREQKSIGKKHHTVTTPLNVCSFHYLEWWCLSIIDNRSISSIATCVRWINSIYDDHSCHRNQLQPKVIAVLTIFVWLLLIDLSCSRDSLRVIKLPLAYFLDQESTQVSPTTSSFIQKEMKL